jgi:hypothetical protein
MIMKIGTNISLLLKINEKSSYFTLIVRKWSNLYSRKTTKKTINNKNRENTN